MGEPESKIFEGSKEDSQGGTYKPRSIIEVLPYHRSKEAPAFTEKPTDLEIFSILMVICLAIVVVVVTLMKVLPSPSKEIIIEESFHVNELQWYGWIRKGVGPWQRVEGCHSPEILSVWMAVVKVFENDPTIERVVLKEPETPIGARK